MISKKEWIAGLLACAALVPAAVCADDQDIIDYRRHIMSSLNEQTGALGMILSTTIAEDNAVAHLEAIALTAQIALKAYERKAPGGQAKPEVWNNWADFSKRMNEFAQRTAAVAKTAKEQGYSLELAPAIVDALSCKGCHDIYRNEKE